MFTESDLKLLKDKGISPSAIEAQIQHFKQGFPYLELQGSATPGHGILVPDEADETAWLGAWQDYLKGSGRVLKFVPASGAASRMFKDLFTFLDAAYDVPTTKAELAFFKGIKAFAFFDALDMACRRNEGSGIDALMEKGAYKAVVRDLLMPEGLNYGALPKGLLLFHAYPGASRTAVVEHLVEGALYACNAQREVNLHFTVSPEHLPLFEAAVQATAPALESLFGLRYAISFSIQKASTDTLAATADNQPFRENGRLVFRPGGHGSLIENLNDLDADIVFIKNIDNVVPDRLKDTTVRYKQVLAGLLVQLRAQTFEYLRLLDSGHYTHDQLVEIIQFLQRNLCTRYDDTKLLEDAELAVYLRHKLNRPIRVCGMVRNQGEPGGGPFWTYNQDGSYSLQILESSQIDLADPAKRALFEQGTHFNPVDLVCSLTDYRGERFHLPDFVDQQTGFISEKSKGGKVLKALERPGLWNGAMSDWNTVFVEVPLLTFNPVKTVNDLLRPEHQPA
ncbi:MAG: DUF4301 family protein [Bacteroidales bacterium]|nr:DUF4301 family protein [Bacteroidales bacterium]